MSNRTPIIAANWKMHKTVGEARAFLDSFLPGCDTSGKEVVIAPPFTALAETEAMLRGLDRVHVAAQNMHHEEKGAFTGEISPLMLLDIGVNWVIIGHSERRHIFGESHGFISRKMAAAVRHGLTPILCVGETLEEREAGHTFDVLREQLATAFEPIGEEGAATVVIAYEPVWAIGTGKTASAGQANEAHRFIREWLSNRFNNTIADTKRILYGGSVKPANISKLMAESEIDGVLVGGASLDAASFLEIVNYG